MPIPKILNYIWINRNDTPREIITPDSCSNTPNITVCCHPTWDNVRIFEPKSNCDLLQMSFRHHKDWTINLWTNNQSSIPMTASFLKAHNVSIKDLSSITSYPNLVEFVHETGVYKTMGTRVDTAKQLVLWETGGVIADINFIFKNPIPDQVLEKLSIISSRENPFFASESKHPSNKLLLDKLDTMNLRLKDENPGSLEIYDLFLTFISSKGDNNIRMIFNGDRGHKIVLPKNFSLSNEKDSICPISSTKDFLSLNYIHSDDIIQETYGISGTYYEDDCLIIPIGVDLLQSSWNNY